MKPEEWKIELKVWKGNRGHINYTVFGTLDQVLLELRKQPELIKKSVEWLEKNGYVV